ncbi:MAG: DUF748 domain-containing protein [Desulfobacterales bacterium]|jgi:outer membrane protein OmpA-like peptidoglycan-associated protein
MQHPSSENTATKKKKVFPIVGFWIFIGLMIVTMLFFIMLPVGIEYGIERYLKDQGADQVALVDVDFNPITGRMTLTNLSVSIRAQTVLNIPQAILNIEWRPFMNKRFVLARFEISDAELTVQAFEDDSWQIGGIKLPGKQETSEPAAWDFGLQQVDVKNCMIKFISPQLSSDLKIEQAKISKLNSWRPERSAHLEFEGQLDGGNLQLQLDVSPFGRDISASGQVKLKGLTLKPFAQLLKPQVNTLEGRLEADLNIETRQTAENGFSHHQKGLLKLSQIQIRIEDTEFSNESIAWDGELKVDIPKLGEVLKISTDGKLNGSKLSLTAKNADMQIQQEQLNWEGKLNFEQTPVAVDLNADSTLSLQNTEVNTADVKLTEEKLNWKGTTQLSFVEKAAEQRIMANGTLAGGMLTVHLVQENLNLTHTGLDWQGKFDYAIEKAGTKINTDGQMRLAAVKFESPQVNLAEEELTWKGALQFSIPPDAGGQKFVADGALNASQLLVSLLNRKLKFKHQGLSWKGRLDSAEPDDLKSLKAEADVILNEIEILNAEKDQPLLNSKGVNLQGIKIDGLDKINVSGIEINGLALLAELKSAQATDADSSLLRLQALEAKDIQLSQQKNLAIESINMKAMKIFLRRDSAGKLPAIEGLNTVQSDEASADQSKPAASDSKTKEKPSDFGFRIGQIEITGDSKLRFQDESVSPAFSIDLSLLEARLDDLDSRQPEKPATLKLLLSDRGDARLSLDGTMQPFAGKLSLDWVGKIESLDLPPLSPYVIQNTGYRFIGGEMQADIPVKVNQNQLEGKIDLILYNPKVEPIKADGSSKENQGKIRLNMSLDSALKLMRDKQNNVKINIPISGDISDPKFSVAEAVNKVLAKTLQTSALSYLKYMLGPYGIGISVAEYAYEQASKIRLNPILFAPGSADLDEAAIEYLKRVAAIMKEYPEVQMSVCGVSTESDRAAMGANASIEDAALLELAKNRMRSIEDHLVKLNGIESKRIITCEPKIDKSAEAEPRVNLEI